MYAINHETPVALVTGGSRGIGRGICLELSKSGFSICINYRSNVEEATKTQRLCLENKIRDNQRFITVKADVSSRNERKTLTDQTIDELGRIDALVNNAGIAPRERKDILTATEESFEEVIKTNLIGPYFLTQTIAKYWLEKKPSPLLEGGFKVVFVTSISSSTVSTNRGEYCISKAGLSMASKLWAIRLGGEGIQVYEIRPGIIDTEMVVKAREKYDKLISEGLVPQNRWGKPSDIGKAVSALLSGYFPFSTGTTIDIDGGLHIQRL